MFKKKVVYKICLFTTGTNNDIFLIITNKEKSQIIICIHFHLLRSAINMSV